MALHSLEAWVRVPPAASVSNDFLVSEFTTWLRVRILSSRFHVGRGRGCRAPLVSRAARAGAARRRLPCRWARGWVCRAMQHGVACRGCPGHNLTCPFLTDEEAERVCEQLPPNCFLRAGTVHGTGDEPWDDIVRRFQERRGSRFSARGTIYGVRKGCLLLVLRSDADDHSPRQGPACGSVRHAAVGGAWPHPASVMRRNVAARSRPGARPVGAL